MAELKSQNNTEQTPDSLQSGAFVQLTYKPQFHFTSQAWEEIRAMDSRPCWWTWERMIEKTTVTWSVRETLS